MSSGPHHLQKVAMLQLCLEFLSMKITKRITAENPNTVLALELQRLDVLEQWTPHSILLQHLPQINISRGTWLWAVSRITCRPVGQTPRPLPRSLREWKTGRLYHDRDEICKRPPYLQWSIKMSVEVMFDGVAVKSRCFHVWTFTPVWATEPWQSQWPQVSHRLFLSSHYGNIKCFLKILSTVLTVLKCEVKLTFKQQYVTLTATRSFEKQNLRMDSNMSHKTAIVVKSSHILRKKSPLVFPLMSYDCSVCLQPFI